MGKEFAAWEEDSNNSLQGVDKWGVGSSSRASRLYLVENSYPGDPLRSRQPLTRNMIQSYQLHAAISPVPAPYPDLTSSYSPIFSRGRCRTYKGSCGLRISEDAENWMYARDPLMAHHHTTRHLQNACCRPDCTMATYVDSLFLQE
jgi:hypothetical protein